MSADALTTPRWDRLSEIIAARTGLHFPPERRADLRRALDQAAPDFGLTDSESCADWLLSSPLSPKELAKLSTHLTIGETYFFRERPSFNALASHVLPLLIQQKRAGERRLRFWSAACSSGEEAYSLAMLVQQVLPDWRDWEISILATDINPQVLRKAAEAIYGEWSFRECGPEIRERFFSPVGDRRYRVQADVRDMVTFAELNLSQDTFPAAVNGTQSLDLILCRNLLIYFTAKHSRRLIGNLRRCLVDDGWLIVSPSECSQALFTGFMPVNLPGSILYRKRDAQAAVIEPLPELPSLHAPQFRAPLSESQVAQILATPAPTMPAPLPLQDDSLARLAGAEAAYTAGRYGEAAAMLSAMLVANLPETTKVSALGLLTRSLANQGKIADALTASEQWLAADKLDPAAHYLHAMVLQELGDRASARASLQRAIYLQPDFTLAHFALGNHARAGARHTEARKHFENAAHLLRGHPADEAVAESEGLTAGRLREIIAALTSGLDA